MRSFANDHRIRLGRGHGARTTSAGLSTATVAAPQPRWRESAGTQPLDFDDTRESFRHKSAAELLRAAFVLELCGVKPLVTHAGALLGLSRRLLGRSLTHLALRQTFFAHFCAGEDDVATVATMRGLERHGVGGILDYAAEADVAPEEERRDVDREDRNRASARTYDYQSEAACDARAGIAMEGIEVAGTRPGGFSAVKLTGLAKPEVLQHASQILTETRELFERHCVESGRLTWEGVQEATKALAAESRISFTDDELRSMFDRTDVNADGSIDYVSCPLRPHTAKVAAPISSRSNA